MKYKYKKKREMDCGVLWIYAGARRHKASQEIQRSILCFALVKICSTRKRERAHDAAIVYKIKLIIKKRLHLRSQSLSRKIYLHPIVRKGHR